MKNMNKFVMSTVIGACVLLGFIGWSFSSPESSVYEKAKSVIDEPYRTHVLSMYGKGSTSDVETWYVSFYDPTAASKAKVVVVTKGKIERVYPSECKTSCDDNKSFDPTLNKISVEKAFQAAKLYAEKNQISYDKTRVLLHRPEIGKAPVWRTELYSAGVSRGFVHLNSTDGTFSSYELPSTHPKSGAEDFANDVERTFKGIGGDLEEFFTGERTVDR